MKFDRAQLRIAMDYVDGIDATARYGRPVSGGLAGW